MGKKLTIKFTMLPKNLMVKIMIATKKDGAQG